jgi:DNA-directed RNA polymerase specialized sigma24 family protein
MELPRKEREALRRFYFLKQPQAEICRALTLTDAEFRNIKIRARQMYEAVRRCG